MPYFNGLQAGVEPFPGYCLTRRLGSGGFGEVWEAQAARGRRVALKFLPCDASQSAVRELRSLQEIRQLRHPHLIRIERVWCYKEYIVVAMELADGSLLELLEIARSQFGTPIGREYCCHLLTQAASALDYLNARQHQINGRCVAVQHCDVKPNNLLLFGETLKLADFGLSSSMSSQREARSRAGTLDYCAPEIFQAQLSNHTDQYALAVTYCLLRGGRLPFHDTPGSFQPRYVRPAPDLTMLCELERPIVARALHPVPQNRWPSCGELLARLTRLVQEGKSNKENRVSCAH
jgi:serine/threonine protein kinase